MVISINKVHDALTFDSDEDKNFQAFPEASSSGTELGLIFLIIEKRGLCQIPNCLDLTVPVTTVITYTQE